MSAVKVECWRFRECCVGSCAGWGRVLWDCQGLRGILEVETVPPGALAVARFWLMVPCFLPIPVRWKVYSLLPSLAEDSRSSSEPEGQQGLPQMRGGSEHRQWGV